MSVSTLRKHKEEQKYQVGQAVFELLDLWVTHLLLEFGYLVQYLQMEKQ